MPYIPPDYNNIKFNFTEAGYTPPDFNKLAMDFGSNEGIRQLKVAITGMELQRDSVKHCETYVVGYDTNAVQILREKCTYLGIRDLGVYLDVVSNFLNLRMYIKQGFREELDLKFNLKGFGHTHIDINTAIKPWYRQIADDLLVKLKAGFSGQLDLSMLLDVFQHEQANFNKVVKGWSVGNVVDLHNSVKAWYKDQLDIPSYLKPTTNENRDLLFKVHKTFERDSIELDFLLHGWDQLDLVKIIQALHIYDLPLTIRATYLSNLNSWIRAVEPLDLRADMHGWDEMYLPAELTISYGPTDIQSYINSVFPSDLSLSIRGMKGMSEPRDLGAYMTNYPEVLLNLQLNILQFSDLNIFLNSTRGAYDLGIQIYPKIVLLRHNVYVNFLEHKDLAIAINHSCTRSAFRELAFYIHGKHKSDLNLVIYGFDNSNIVNLGCTINSYDYITTDLIEVAHFKNDIRTYIDIKHTKKAPIFQIDTIPIYSANIDKGFLDLGLDITGEMIYTDFPVSLNCVSNLHYKRSNTHEYFVTLKLKNNQEDFRRYVELTFNNYAEQYYYFSGGQRAYKADPRDNWIIRVEGHELLPVGRGYEKDKVLRKYIFNMRNYDSVDEAIRDMIDRVTMMKYNDLSISILPDLFRHSDLSAVIRPKRIFKSNRVLNLRMRSTVPSINDLMSAVKGILPNGDLDLGLSINGIDYISPTDGNVNFSFTDEEDLPSADDVNFEFIFGED